MYYIESNGPPGLAAGAAPARPPAGASGSEGRGAQRHELELPLPLPQPMEVQEGERLELLVTFWMTNVQVSVRRVQPEQQRGGGGNGGAGVPDGAQRAQAGARPVKKRRHCPVGGCTFWNHDALMTESGLVYSPYEE